MSEFRKLQALPPNRLDSRALEELEALLLQDFAPHQDALEITADVDDKRVGAPSVKDLLSRLTGAEPQSIRFRALDRRETNSTRGVTVEAYPLWAQCQVHGLDEAWFRGKLHQIDAFFLRNRPWYGLARPLLPFAIGGVVALLGMSAAYLYSTSNYFLGLAPVVALALTLRVANACLKGRLAPHSRIVLMPRRSIISAQTLTLFFAAISAFAAVAAVIVEARKDEASQRPNNSSKPTPLRGAA